MALIHRESFNEEHFISGNVQDKQVTVRLTAFQTTEKSAPGQKKYFSICSLGNVYLVLLPSSL